MERILKQSILGDLDSQGDSKIIFISGPRQCGKTTLARDLTAEFTYYNYDFIEDKKLLNAGRLDFSRVTLILDELHKMRRWKTWLKGFYDVYRGKHQFVVTGSSRLDTYKRVGDSLAGRYFNFRLFPFDLKELAVVLPEKSPEKLEELLGRLDETGGFPEPFLKARRSFYLRWRRTHLDIILRQDLLETEALRDIPRIELLVELLRARIGSTFSHNSMREDLSTDDKTVRRWMDALERCYLLFKVTPYSKRIKYALSKSPKYYYYDHARVEDPGARFENLVGLALLKEISFRTDTTGEDYSLHYLRDKQGHEVDFLICHDGEPTMMIECKVSDSEPSSNFAVFGKQLPGVRRLQVVKDLKREFRSPAGVEVVKASRWLATLDF